jgi:hypothetical protein
MKPTYLNELTASFALWADHVMLKDAEAFHNESGKLFYTFDPDFKNYKIYGSEFRQWVCDRDIEGANIPSGIFSGSVFLPKAPGNIRIDYGMGRVIMKSSTPADLSVFSCPYAAKDFNIYTTSKSEVDLLFEGADIKAQKRGKQPEALNYKDEPYPAIFVKFMGGENKPFAFGGVDEADWNVRCTVIAADNFSLDAVCSVFVDRAHTHFPLVPSSGIPFNIYGDTKATGDVGYSYSQLCQENSYNLIYVSDVTVSKFSERVNREIKDDIWGAFIDFRLLDVKM